MERPTRIAELRPGLVGIVGVAVCVVAGYGVTRTYEPALVREFNHEFTDDGQCLDGTKFDPAKDAKVTVRKIENGHVVDVRPADDSRTIHLLKDNEGLQYSDHVSATILNANGCRLPNGS